MISHCNIHQEVAFPRVISCQHPTSMSTINSSCLLQFFCRLICCLFLGEDDVGEGTRADVGGGTGAATAEGGTGAANLGGGTDALPIP